MAENQVQSIDEQLGIDGLDLDTKDAAGQKFVFIPKAEGYVDLHVLYLRQFKGAKAGSSITAKVKVVGTPTIEGVEVDREYDLLFSFKDTTTSKYSNQSLREIMCGIYGGDPTNSKSTKVNERLVATIKEGEDFEFAGKVIRMVNVGNPAFATDPVTKVKTPIIDPATGKQKIYYNPAFQKSPVVVEIE